MGSCPTILSGALPRRSHCTPSSCSTYSSSNVQSWAIRRSLSKSYTCLPPAVRGRSPSTARQDFVRRQWTRLNRPERQPNRTCLWVHTTGRADPIFFTARLATTALFVGRDALYRVASNCQFRVAILSSRKLRHFTAEIVVSPSANDGNDGNHHSHQPHRRGSSKAVVGRPHRRRATLSATSIQVSGPTLAESAAVRAKSGCCKPPGQIGAGSR